jgi:hypothetical protein
VRELQNKILDGIEEPYKSLVLMHAKRANDDKELPKTPKQQLESVCKRFNFSMENIKSPGAVFANLFLAHDALIYADEYYETNTAMIETDTPRFEIRRAIALLTDSMCTESYETAVAMFPDISDLLQRLKTYYSGN